MRARVCSGVQGAARPRDLTRSVGPSRFHTTFRLGFPKSSKVQKSLYTLATAPALSPKNELIVCASCKGPAGRAWEVSSSTKEPSWGSEGWGGQVTRGIGAESGPEPHGSRDPTPRGSLRRQQLPRMEESCLGTP